MTLQSGCNFPRTELPEVATGSTLAGESSPRPPPVLYWPPALPLTTLPPLTPSPASVPMLPRPPRNRDCHQRQRRRNHSTGGVNTSLLKRDFPLRSPPPLTLRCHYPQSQELPWQQPASRGMTRPVAANSGTFSDTNTKTDTRVPPPELRYFRCHKYMYQKRQNWCSLYHSNQIH